MNFLGRIPREIQLEITGWLRAVEHLVAAKAAGLAVSETHFESIARDEHRSNYSRCIYVIQTRLKYSIEEYTYPDSVNTVFSKMYFDYGNSLWIYLYIYEGQVYKKAEHGTYSGNMIRYAHEYESKVINISRKIIKWKFVSKSTRDEDVLSQ